MKIFIFLFHDEESKMANSETLTSSYNQPTMFKTPNWPKNVSIEKEECFRKNTNNWNNVMLVAEKPKGRKQSPITHCIIIWLTKRFSFS